MVHMQVSYSLSLRKLWAQVLALAQLQVQQPQLQVL